MRKQKEEKANNKIHDALPKINWKLVVVLGILVVCALAFSRLPEYGPDDCVLKIANWFELIFKWIAISLAVWEFFAAFLCGGSHPEYAISVIFMAALTLLAVLVCPRFLPNVFVVMCVQCAIMTINKAIFEVMSANRGDE